MKLEKLHVVVYQEGDWWLAVGLEHCITTQAKTLSEVLEGFEEMLQTQLLLPSGLEPYPPADPEEWARFNQAKTAASSLALPIDPALPQVRDSLETRIAA